MVFISLFRVSFLRVYLVYDFNTNNNNVNYSKVDWTCTIRATHWVAVADA